ncbi:putative carnitine operon oxidoreductase caia [Brucella suis]|nr:hypothetical protein C050_01060 [Brucella suis 92/63]ENT39209.1 hypothetical protein C049_01091 [Brucella suis F12/02]ENT45824.1 hypothetical protein B986_00059 [Brucella suis F5/05-10]ERT82515.1 hypothetical protein P048_01661 [Brucella suis 04-0115]KFJ31440.1 putative carnitine operon oxidoreductase caia [Brucella suis]
MFSRRILLAGIASLCMGAAAPAFAASPVNAEAQLDEAAANVQKVALASNAKANPDKPKKKTAARTNNTAKANKYSIDPKFRPQDVTFTGYKPGTIVIDPKKRFLYLVETSTTARRYGIAVGKQGLEFQGKATISAKREWPRWIPTKEMIERDPAIMAASRTAWMVARAIRSARVRCISSRATKTPISASTVRCSHGPSAALPPMAASA